MSDEVVKSNQQLSLWEEGAQLSVKEKADLMGGVTESGFDAFGPPRFFRQAENQELEESLYNDTTHTGWQPALKLASEAAQEKTELGASFADTQQAQFKGKGRKGKEPSRYAAAVSWKPSGTLFRDNYPEERIPEVVEPRGASRSPSPSESEGDTFRRETTSVSKIDTITERAARSTPQRHSPLSISAGFNESSDRAETEQLRQRLDQYEKEIGGIREMQITLMKSMKGLQLQVNQQESLIDELVQVLKQGQVKTRVTEQLAVSSVAPPKATTIIASSSAPVKTILVPSKFSAKIKDRNLRDRF